MASERRLANSATCLGSAADRARRISSLGELSRSRLAPVPDIAGNHAVIEANDLGNAGLLGAHDMPHVLWIELCGDCGRSDQVAEHHCKLPSLGLVSPRLGFAFVAGGRRRVELGKSPCAPMNPPIDRGRPDRAPFYRCIGGYDMGAATAMSVRPFLPLAPAVLIIISTPDTSV
jgi:hypothetical protein